MTITAKGLGAPLVIASIIFVACGGDVEKRPIQAEQTVPTQESAPPPPSPVDPATAARIAAVRSALDSGMEVDGTDENGRTALMMAAFDGYTDVVKLLLEHGADVHRMDPEGRTALMFAATGPFPETVDLLLEYGASVDRADTVESWTALMFAAGEGQLAVAELLLRYGADPKIKDADGDSAIDHARARGHSAVVRLLEVASG